MKKKIVINLRKTYPLAVWIQNDSDVELIKELKNFELWFRNYRKNEGEIGYIFNKQCVALTLREYMTLRAYYKNRPKNKKEK